MSAGTRRAPQTTPGRWVRIPGTAKVIAGEIKQAAPGVPTGYEGRDVASAHGRTADERGANADLIAQAPAMREVLELVDRALAAGPISTKSDRDHLRERIKEALQQS